MSAKAKLMRRCSRQRKNYERRLANEYWDWLVSVMRKNPPRRPRCCRKNRLRLVFENKVLPKLEEWRARAAAESAQLPAEGEEVKPNTKKTLTKGTL